MLNSKKLLPSAVSGTKVPEMDRLSQAPGACGPHTKFSHFDIWFHFFTHLILIFDKNTIFSSFGVTWPLKWPIWPLISPKRHMHMVRIHISTIFTSNPYFFSYLILISVKNTYISNEGQNDPQHAILTLISPWCMVRLHNNVTYYNTYSLIQLSIYQ